MHIFLDAGNGNILAFFELPSKPPMDRDRNTPTWTQHLAMEVGSIDEMMAAKARMEADGIEVLGPTDHTHLQVDLLPRPQRPPARAGGEHRHAGDDRSSSTT
jgi:hypothetical protein